VKEQEVVDFVDLAKCALVVAIKKFQNCGMFTYETSTATGQEEQDYLDHWLLELPYRRKLELPIRPTGLAKSSGTNYWAPTMYTISLTAGRVVHRAVMYDSHAPWWGARYMARARRWAAHLTYTQPRCFLA
jgi:hypothetical protein